MEWINDIVKIIIGEKIIVTWIVVGWLLLIFVILKPLHGISKWKDIVRGAGEVRLGAAWAIICGLLFHPFPGLSIMLFISFGAFHWIRSWVDRLGVIQSQPRRVIRWFYIGYYLLTIGVVGWYFEYSFLFDTKRGIAQLTSNTVFPEAGKSCKHWFACDCTFPMRRTGIRPSEPKVVSADSSFLPFDLKTTSQAHVRKTAARSK